MRDADGKTRVVFVVSDAVKPVTAIVLAGATVQSLRDPLANEVFQVDDGRVSVAMPARGVRLLVAGDVMKASSVIGFVAACLLVACGGKSLHLKMVDASVKQPSNVAVYFNVTYRWASACPI